VAYLALSVKTSRLTRAWVPGESRAGWATVRPPADGAEGPGYGWRAGRGAGALAAALHAGCRDGGSRGVPDPTYGQGV